MAGWSLDKLVAPHSAEAFFTTRFEADWLLVARDSPDYFAGLLTLDDVDRIIATVEARHGDISLVNADGRIEAADYLDPDHTINAGQVFRLHAAGATVILNHLHRRHGPLADLCAALEATFSAALQTNVYLTPPRARGFKAHFDTHDVFILQIAGTKQWRLYDTPVELPLRGHGDDPLEPPAGPPRAEFELRSGDTLYIPRGLVHEAVSGEAASLHVTLGVLSRTWFDFMLEAVAAQAATDRGLRAALPPGFASPAFDREVVRRMFRDLVARLASGADVDAVLDRFVGQFVDTRRPRLRGQLAELARIEAIGLDDTLCRRPHLACLIDEGAETVTVSWQGRQIALPAHAGPALRHALESARFRVRDLPGDLDDAGKLVLVRRLVREGLLQGLAPEG